MKETGGLHKENGVFISPLTQTKFTEFEKNYLLARGKENRILSVQEIRNLPNVPTTYIHYNEWEIRKKNIFRFLKYLSEKKKQLHILDIGCGNGFFTNMMAKDHRIVGVDVNLLELKQAAEAFPESHIKWYYLDILAEELPENKFDLITFCASFQYFDKPKDLLKRCLHLLNKGGEIHIIDSPFYSSDNLNIARQNSLNYYRSIGTEDMSNYYNHNTFDVLKEYPFKCLYKPSFIRNKLLRIKDSPFPWIRIKT